jgi:hypothetical protein
LLIDTSTGDALLPALAALLEEQDGPLHVVITQNNMRLELRVAPVAAAPPPTVTAAAPKTARPLSKSEKDVLEAVVGLGGAPGSGQVVGRVGFGQGHVSKVMNRLRRRGLLAGDKGEHGYRLTEEGLAALAAEPAADAPINSVTHLNDLA